MSNAPPPREQPETFLTGQRIEEIDGPETFKRVFDVSRDTLAKLSLYESLLKRWQRAHNLVAPNSLEAVWPRHFADSAQLMRLAPNARIWLDLGSGAGFPGLVLAILAGADSEKAFHLVESTGRKCAFLETVIRETGAPAQVHQTRIEAFEGLPKGPPDIITARALAPLHGLLDYAVALSGPETRLILPKGQDVDNEWKVAAHSRKYDVQAIASLTQPAVRVLLISTPERRSHP